MLSDKEFLTEVNEKYLNEFRSLNKTCRWLKQEHGIHINRIKLSNLFHKADLRVLAPNGGIEEYRGDRNAYEWASNINELAARFIEDVYNDIRGYLKGEVSRIDFISACASLGSDLYERFLETLQSAGRVRVRADVLPPDIPQEVVLAGIDIYRRNALFWVESVAS